MFDIHRQHRYFRGGMLARGVGILFSFIFSISAYAAGKALCPSELTASWKTNLVVHHFSVGQGDATFIRTPSGKTFLIDGGLGGQGRKTILPAIKRCYTEENETPKIDYIIVTHPHIDHFGGIRDLLQEVILGNLDVDFVFDTGSEIQVKKSAELEKYRALRDQAAERGLLKKVVPAPGTKMQISDGTVVSIVAVNGKVKGKTPIKMTNAHGIAEGENLNALSIAAKIRYGTFDYFIGGDLTGGGDSTPDVESNVATVVGEIDVYHANHHGSNTSSNKKLLKTMKPKAVIVSVGDGGMNAAYQLPRKETIDRILGTSSVKGIYLTAQGALKQPLPKKVYNEKGDIVIVANNKSKYIVNKASFETDKK